MKNFYSFSTALFFSAVMGFCNASQALAQAPVEQVQRDFQVRYHLLTGDYLLWPPCSSGSTPAPQFPKDGFYGGISQDPYAGVIVVQDLVQKFYWSNIVYTNFVKANSPADLQGASNITSYLSTDMQPVPQVSDVTTNNYLDILGTIAAHIAGLNLIQVQGSQVTSASDARVSYSQRSGGIGDCASVQYCATNSLASTSWGNFVRYLPTACGVDAVNQATQYTSIGVVYDTGKWNVLSGRPQAAARNSRGKISADLRAYSTGTASIYLKLKRPTLNDAFYGPPFYGSSTTSFDLAHPTSAAENTYGLWTNLALGSISTSDYVTYSDATPGVGGVCVTSSGDVHGWLISDAVVIVAPDFSSIPDAQDCCACAKCDAGTTTSSLQSLQSIHVDIPLGSDNFGNSAGALTLSASQPTTVLATPSGLRYSVASTVESITGLSAQHFQFRTSQNLIDILTNNSYAYTISFYTAADGGSKDGSGFYQPTGTAYTTVLVQNPDGASATNHLRVTTTTSSIPSATDYIYNSTTAQWEMDTGSGLRKEIRVSTWNNNSTIRTETVTVTNSNNQLVYKEINVYQLFPWGQERVTNIVDPDSAVLTSTWAFYTNATTDGGGYRQLKQQVDANGHWVQHQYDPDGRETNRITQFLNSAVGSVPNSNRVTTTTYSTNAPQITAIDFLLGTEISRRYQIVTSGEVDDIQCQTQNAPLNAADNLTNITRKYTSGSFAGQPYRVQKPDGTVLVYLYSTNASLKTTVLLSGIPDPASDTNIVNGTITTTVAMLGGQVLTNAIVSRMPGASDIITAQDVYTYTDSRNRSYTVAHLDGTTEQFTYACCGLDSSTDRDGVTTHYFYDALSRQFGSLRNGITSSNIFDPNGAVLASVRVGSDNSAITNLQQIFDVAGRLAFETNALSGGTVHTYYFDGVGQLVKQTTNPDGGTRVEAYFQDGSLQSVSGTAVQAASYRYGVDSDGPFTLEQKLDVNGGTNEWVKTSTDMMGRLYKTALAAASGTPYSISFYNRLGQLTNQVDPDGVSTVFAYNQKGEQIYSVLDSNRNYTIDFTGADRITFVTNDVVADNGTNVRRTRTYVWSTSANTSTLISTAETSVDGLKSWNTVWNNGVAVTAANTTVYASGGVRYVTNTAPDNSFTVSTYRTGLVASVVQKDSAGNQLSSVSYSYDPHGRQNVSTDARNGATTLYFNNADQASGTTTPIPGAGQTAQVTTNFFDNVGRIWKTTLPDNTSVTNEYYPTGLLKRNYGSRTYPVAYSYDAQGRLKTMTNWTSFSSGAGSRSTTWNYDVYRGFLTNKTYAGNAAGPRHSYTAARRLMTRLWARGTNTTYSYNNAGDLAGVTYNDGSTPSVSYGYDRRGRQTSITNGTSVCSLSDDDAGNLLGETYSGAGSTLNGFVITNLFDSLLRRTTNGFLNGSTWLSQTRYGYGQASRLQTVSDGTNTAGYGYVANSALIGQVLFTNTSALRLTTSKYYDYLNRLTAISNISSQAGNIGSFAYTYNSANQRTGFTNADNSKWSFGYDNLGQVTSGKKYWSDGTIVAGEQFTYAFDDIGNRTSTARGGDQTGSNLRSASYYANALNQYTNRTIPAYLDILGSANSNANVLVESGWGPAPWQDWHGIAYRKGEFFRAESPLDNAGSPVWVAFTNIAALPGGTTADIQSNSTGGLFVPRTPEQFTYDADGNLIADGRWAYSWDGENRLVRMVANLYGAPVQTIAFEYDSRGRRIHKQVWNNATGSGTPTNDVKFVYERWNLLGELSSSNTVLRTYIWGNDLSGSPQGAGGVSGLIAMNDSAQGIHFVAYDGNGNVATLTKAIDATTSAYYEYGPFGEGIRATGTMARRNPFMFSTKYLDQETDFLYFGYRYYAASTGRWINRDPLAERTGLGLYNFVGNDSENKIDMFGLWEDNGTGGIAPETPEGQLRLLFESAPRGSDPHEPSDAIYVTDADQILADAKQKIGDKYDPSGTCGKCIKKLIISGHGGGAGAIPMGSVEYSSDTYQNYIRFKSAMSAHGFAAYSVQPYVQQTLTGRDILEKLAALKCQRIDVTILACNAGEGAQGDLLRKQILEVFGPNATVHTYRGACGFMLGGFPTSKGDILQTGRDTESN